MPGPAPTAEALRRHVAACEADQDGYLDPLSGLFVLTSVHLRRRDWCCAAGCRHCPYTPSEQARAGRPQGIGAWPWGRS